MTLDRSEPSDVYDLIIHHAPELIPTFSTANRVTSHVAALVVSLYLSVWIAFLLVGDAYSSSIVTPVISVIFAALGAAVTESVLRVTQSRAVKRFFDRAAGDPTRVYGVVAAKFREEIELQRKRTLGPDSEWGRSRAPLQEALNEANRSAAYWQERVRTDPASAHARTQLEAASRIEDRFREALRQLDHRSDALLSFFSRCEAKLAVLEHGKRDLEESQRLAALLERAESVVADAELTLELIGRELMSEVAWIGRALGGLERIQTVHLAGELPLETVEVLAERVIESATQENERLRELLEA